MMIVNDHLGLSLIIVNGLVSLMTKSSSGYLAGFGGRQFWTYAKARNWPGPVLAKFDQLTSLGP